MFVWSKRFAITGLILFVIFEVFLIVQTSTQETSDIRPHTIQYILVNYVLLMAWVFLWMFDQARLRGVNLWIWLLPFVFAPLPTILVFILFLQRRKGL
jgi:hypothetical protein